MKGLAGKVVLVTGAAGAGIGQATARRCAEEGCTVVVTDIHTRRTEQVTHELAADYGSRVLGFVMDIADRKQVDDVFAKVVDRCGRLDVLVNNAAINILEGVAELRPADWDRVVDVDLSAIYYCMHKALPIMIAQKSGCIINVSSVAAWGSGKAEAAYSACKAAMLSLTRSVAADYGSAGIRCNVVAPGSRCRRSCSAAHWPAAPPRCARGANRLARALLSGPHAAPCSATVAEAKGRTLSSPAIHRSVPVLRPPAGCKCETGRPIPPAGCNQAAKGKAGAGWEDTGPARLTARGLMSGGQLDHSAQLAAARCEKFTRPAVALGAL